MNVSDTLSAERIKQMLEFNDQLDEDCPEVSAEQFSKGHFKNYEKIKDSSSNNSENIVKD